MLVRILNPQGLEGACSYMQGHEGRFDAARIKLVHNVFIEVESGCRCSHGPGMARIDGLIT